MPNANKYTSKINLLVWKSLDASSDLTHKIRLRERSKQTSTKTNFPSFKQLNKFIYFFHLLATIANITAFTLSRHSDGERGGECISHH